MPCRNTCPAPPPGPAAPRRLIASCEARRESLLVEGVHLSLNFVVKLMEVRRRRGLAGWVGRRVSGKGGRAGGRAGGRVCSSSPGAVPHHLASTASVGVC